MEDWRLCGDWRLYLQLLTGQTGRVAYIPEALNTHRRHADGVTAKLDATAHLREIERLHDVATNLLALNDTARQAQAAYRARLSSQFTRTGKKALKPVARRKKV
uniref:CAZy families GT2/GT4 protein n=1 Tax=uncultured Acidiphilium sp. TaxID=240137 RepID=A0A060BPE4_9PROT|nr:CAZy families GT2/GT4 protein [uncultured Acidiphilium sp.]